MFVTFFTSRVVLDKLGFVDYGIQNVVGGLASMFVFFRSSLSNATQRFLSISLARGDDQESNWIFCQHQSLYIVIAIAMVIMAECAGLWLLYNKLVIPPEREAAAFWVFQFTVLSLVVTMCSIVYDSVLIAHEKMSVYAYVGICEGIAKLLIAYMISIVAYDRLIVYNILLFLVSLGVFTFYAYYCTSHFQEAVFRFFWDKKRVRQTFSFINWNVIGTAVWAINEYGLNLLLNVFFGLIVNAARGIAFQVNQAVNHFSTNFYTAVRPQIMKSYAVGDYDYLMRLIFSASKFSVFLLWYLSLPIMLCIDVILAFWLKDVPQYTNVFTIWVLLYSIVNSLTNPIWSLALAIGHLKRYILIGSSVFLMAFPVSYVLLKFGAPPVSVFIVMFFVRTVYVCVTLIILKKEIEISLVAYMRSVVLPIIWVLAVSGAICVAMKQWLPDSLYGLAGMVLVTTLVISGSLWLFGLKQTEKKMIRAFVAEKVLSKWK